MSDWKKSLEWMMGKEGFETLSKAIYRRDSDSTIGPLDVYLPLLVVPRSILSWLTQNISPLKVGEGKSFVFPGMDEFVIRIEKIGRDSYRGEFLRDGEVVHSFDKQTLPNLGGNIMSMGEMYSSFAENYDRNAEKPNPGPGLSMPEAIMQNIDIPETPKIDSANAEALITLTNSIGKLVDALIANHTTKTNVKASIANIKIDEEDEDDDTEPEEIEKDDVRKTSFQEQPPGQAVPKKPDGTQEPTKPSRRQIGKDTYFRERLKHIRGIEKKEKRYHISTEDLYTPCIHCGVPEFKKAEDGPKYNPCACFFVTLRTEDGKSTNFVSITKNEKDGYELIFNKKADKDTVQAFISTLKSRLDKQKKDLD